MVGMIWPSFFGKTVFSLGGVFFGADAINSA